MVVANRTVDIAELKARHPLGDAVEAAGVGLRGKGRVRQGVCPFHEELEGSFTVYADSEKFYCFGCGAAGDVLDFVGRMEGLTLSEAIRRLDDGAEIFSAPARHPAPTPRPSAPAVAASRSRPARRRWSGSTPVNSGAAPGPGRTWRRGALDSTPLMRLGLGYAAGNGLRQHLDSLGFNPDRQRASGLVPGARRGAVRRDDHRSRHPGFGPGTVAHRKGG